MLLLLVAIALPRGPCEGHPPPGGGTKQGGREPPVAGERNAYFPRVDRERRGLVEGWERIVGLTRPELQVTRGRGEGQLDYGRSAASERTAWDKRISRIIDAEKKMELE